MGKLDGKVILVTGGGGGVGSGLVLALAREGADVAIAERIQERGEGAARAVEALGRRAIAIECDVSRRDQVDAAPNGDDAETRVVGDGDPGEVLVPNGRVPRWERVRVAGLEPRFSRK
mgnify:CR=1 FL=1